MSSDTVPVTQADRELGWLLLKGRGLTQHDGEAIKAGGWDYTPEIQAIARHRLAATPTPSPAMPSREEMAALVEALRPFAEYASEVLSSWRKYPKDGPETVHCSWGSAAITRGDCERAVETLAALTSVDRAGQGFVDCGDCGGSGCRVEPGCCGNCEWECGGRGCSGPIPVQEQCRTCGGAGQFPADPPALSSIGSEAE